MDDLIAFLRARLDEDEQVARATTPTFRNEWRVTRDKHAASDATPELIQGQDEDHPDYPDYSYGVPVIAFSAEWQDEAVANLQHIARHDPARVLAEVDAKRRILDRAVFVSSHGPAVDHARALDMTTGAAAALRDVLKMIALPYAGHPDYGQEWKP